MIKLVNPEGNQPWILIGRTDTKAEAPILWPPDVNSPGKDQGWWSFGKDPEAEKRLKAKGEESGRGWDGWIASPTQ